MVVEKLNERGQIRHLGDNPEYAFHYVSKFYGECTFTARVSKSWDEGLTLEAASVDVQHHIVQRGTRAGLLSSAQVFFNTVLHGLDSLEGVEAAPLPGTEEAPGRAGWHGVPAGTLAE